MAADSLVARHREMPEGGWAWRSSIQAPHYQTDRDVGAASIGAGLLAAYAVTGDARYRRAAVSAGDFLLGVAEPAAGGLRWPDWADPNGERSATHFTSFDDGAAGISDYLWRLFRATREPRFRDGALAGMRWLIAQADGASCPRASCSWRWTDDPSWRVGYNGVGMGQAGIVLTLDAFADRTGDPTFRAYARAGAARLRELTADGTRPLPRGSRGRDARDRIPVGLGRSGVHVPRALRTRSRSRRSRDRARAAALGERPGGRGRARAGCHWPISRRQRGDAGRVRTGGCRHRVGQPAGLSTRPAIASTATSPAGRPSGCGPSRSPDRHGPSCPATPPFRSMSGSTAGRPGSAGCWRTSLARALTRPPTGRPPGRRSRVSAPTRGRDRHGAFWYANRTGSRPRLRAEPSWHWGSAGIAAFAARLAGWSGSGPGGQRR